MTVIAQDNHLTAGAWAACAPAAVSCVELTIICKHFTMVTKLLKIKARVLNYFQMQEGGTQLTAKTIIKLIKAIVQVKLCQYTFIT